MLWPSFSLIWAVPQNIPLLLEGHPSLKLRDGEKTVMQMEAQTLIYNWNILLLSPLYLGKTYPEKHIHYNIRSLGQKIVDFFGGGIFKTVSDCKLFYSNPAILQILCAVPIIV